MFDVEYFVNEEKKVVVAKITNCYGDLCCDMCKVGFPPHSDFEIQDSFVGKAKCSPDDTFDVEKGKKIAFKRAYMKYTAVKMKTISNFMKGYRKAYEELELTTKKLIARYDSAIDNRATEIKAIIAN